MAKEVQGFNTIGHRDLMGQLDRKVKAQLDVILRKHKSKEGALIPVLQEIQKSQGYISRPVMAYVAKSLKLPLAEVFGVASFYAQFYLEKRGENMIRVCLGTACHVKGAEGVLEAFSDELAVEVGGTTKNKMFSLERVGCLGACGLAPVVMVNDKTYSKMTPERVPEIIAEIVKEKNIPAITAERRDREIIAEAGDRERTGLI